jgi:tRNA dimethylallyltransferase
MTPDTFRHALILTGPTGSGKSRLALTLAERLGAEIVAMDSMTLYRGMDIGTAKPTAEDRRRVPHHLLDVLDPWESASVAWWLERAALCCREIENRGRRVLFVGGTPLYLRALLQGLFPGPPADEAIRSRLAALADAEGAQALHARLGTVDPASAARLHPHDVRRVIRALEVWELTGRPMSSWQTQWRQPLPDTQEQENPGPPRCLWLDLPRDVLYERIDARVQRMVSAGLIEEVRRLRDLPRPLSREARQALGYKEVFAHLEGRQSLEETVQLIQTRTRNFAKRQLTWFRNLSGCQCATEELTFLWWASRIEMDGEE